MRTLQSGLLAAALLLLVGCGVLPEPPDESYGAPSPTALVPAGTGETSATPSDVPTAGLAAAERAAVRVRNVRCAGLSVGSGFPVDEHTLVTNRHVVEGARDLQLETADGRDIEVTATGSATVADLAVVRTDQELPQALPLAVADPVPGQLVTVVGYPEGGPRTVSRGVVEGFVQDPLGGETQVIVSTATVAPGNSGSPMLDDSGAVVGVVYAAETESGRAVAVPVSVLRELLARGDEALSPDPSGTCST